MAHSHSHMTQKSKLVLFLRRFRRTLMRAMWIGLYSGGWNFRQYFFAILYLSHPLTSVQNLRRSSHAGSPSVGGVKRNRDSKIERCHVRVSHLKMSFLSITGAWEPRKILCQGRFHLFRKMQVKTGVNRSPGCHSADCTKFPDFFSPLLIINDVSYKAIL